MGVGGEVGTGSTGDGSPAVSSATALKTFRSVPTLGSVDGGNLTWLHARPRDLRHERAARKDRSEEEGPALPAAVAAVARARPAERYGERAPVTKTQLNSSIHGKVTETIFNSTRRCLKHP